MNFKTARNWPARKLSGRVSPAVCLGVAAFLGIVWTAHAQTNTSTNVTTTTFSNSTPISITYPNVVPYPSTIQVPFGGTIQKVTVTLYGLAHPTPSDIQGIMVAGPTNSGSQVAIELMSEAGDSDEITNVDVTFDDAATNQLPSGSQIISGTYQVSIYFLGDYYPPTANGQPAPTYSTNDVLADFIGTPMQGEWGLYISDFGVNNGSINGGWGLTITYVGGTGTNIPPTGLAISSPIALTSGQLQFTVSGSAGTAFSIEDSSDLENWTVVTNQTMPGSGSVTFTTATAPSRSLFYRAIVTGGTPPPGGPTLSSPTVLANGQFQFTLAGKSGTSYWIEESGDLQSWTSIATNAASANGALIFTDPRPVTGNRFYRAVVAP